MLEKAGSAYSKIERICDWYTVTIGLLIVSWTEKSEELGGRVFSVIHVLTHVENTLDYTVV